MKYPPFYIKPEEGGKVLYSPNEAQEKLLNNLTGRDIIVKARKLGMTTAMQIEMLRRIIKNDNYSCATVAHRMDSAKRIFKIAKFAFDNHPCKDLLKPNYDNIRELTLESTGSSLYVDASYRGDTNQFLHISELAHFDNQQDFLAGSLAAVPPKEKGGCVVIETTPKGMGYFYDLVQDGLAGKNEWTVHFFPWFIKKSYQTKVPDFDFKKEYQTLVGDYNLVENIQEEFNLTDEQFFWYYLKARDLKELVKQEYPTTIEEAFVSSSYNVFNLNKISEVVSPIDKWNEFEIWEQPIQEDRENKIDKGKYIIGVDTAEGKGGDRSVAEVFKIDGKKLIQVAEFCGQCSPDELGLKAIQISAHYNNAFIVPERNASGLTTCLTILGQGANVYMETDIKRPDANSKNMVGWITSSVTRPVMIDDFVSAFDDGHIVIKSSNLIEETRAFVRKKNGKREAEEGKHDDCLFASFLALQGLKYNQTPTFSR